MSCDLTPWDVVSLRDVAELGLRTFDAGFAPDRLCECGRTIPGWSRSPRCDRCRVTHRRAGAAARARARYVPAAERTTEEQTQRLAARRSWWRAHNPLPACVDCGAEVVGRSDNKRCPECRLVWRRKLNAECQRRYRRKSV